MQFARVYHTCGKSDLLEDCKACQREFETVQDKARKAVFYRGSGIIAECAVCGCFFDPMGNTHGTCPVCPMVAQIAQEIAIEDAAFLKSCNIRWD